MEKGNVFLLIQGASVKEEDSLFKNDIKIDNDNDKFPRIIKLIVDRENCKKVFVRQSLSVYKGKFNLHGENKKYYLIYSNFIEKDVVGREICYMSLIYDVKNLSEAVDRLNEVSTSHGFTVSSEDIDTIKKKDRGVFNKKVIFLLILLAIIILIIYGTRK